MLAENPELAFELYCQASEIVDDFEDYGPMLQADEDGQYTEETTVRRLEKVRNELRALIRESTIGQPYPPPGSLGVTITTFSRSHTASPGGAFFGLLTYFFCV